MKKLVTLWMTILVFVLMSGSAFAQAQFLIDDQNPRALTLLTVPPDNCQTVTITLDPGGEINTSLIMAGCGISYDESQVLITNVVVADADAAFGDAVRARKCNLLANDLVGCPNRRSQRHHNQQGKSGRRLIHGNS